MHEDEHRCINVTSSIITSSVLSKEKMSPCQVCAGEVLTSLPRECAMRTLVVAKQKYMHPSGVQSRPDDGGLPAGCSGVSEL